MPVSDETLSTFKHVNDQLWLKIESGELDRAGLHKIRFEIVLKELGLVADGQKIEKEFKENLYDIAIPVAGAKETLEYLSSKYLVYCASNALYNLQAKRLAKVGLLTYVKDLFISEVIGFNKPSKEFFDQCFKKMNGVLPTETVMIGDSLTADINGGKDYGMTTVWYNHDKSISKSEKADHKIDNLLEITKIL